MGFVKRGQGHRRAAAHAADSPKESPRGFHFPLECFVFREVIYKRSEQKAILDSVLVAFCDLLMEYRDCFSGGEPPRGHGLHVAVDRLRNYLANCLVCFKDAAFEDENEWRYIFFHLDGPDEKSRVKYRVRNGSFIPYLELNLFEQSQSSMYASHIACGPTLHPELSAKAVKRWRPSLRVALALCLATETGGPSDYEGGHVILGDVLTDDIASDPLRGMAAAALADSARLGRGMDPDLEMAKDMYATALELGHRSAAYNLGLYWEGRWDASAPGDVVPDSTKAAQAYKRGGSNAKCASRLDALRARSR